MSKPIPAKETPQAVYKSEAEAAREESAQWRKKERLISHARLATFILALGLGWLIFGSHQIRTFWIVPPVIFFIALLVIHDRSIRKRTRAEMITDFYERGLDRLNHTWQGKGNSGAAHLDPTHPYANDLDLFGHGSLFELLCTTRTRAGETVLAGWLQTPCPAIESQQRQEAVRELTDRVHLRKDLWLLGPGTQTSATDANLAEWALGPIALKNKALRWVGLALTGLTLATAAGWIWTSVGLIPVVAAALLQSAFALALRPQVSSILSASQAPGHELTVLSRLLSLIENEPVHSERLTFLRSRLEVNGAPPSTRIAELRRLLDLLDARSNQFFSPIGAILLWGTQVAISLEAWRAQSGPVLEEWIAAAAEIEALCALAGYAYENPAAVYPEWAQEGPCFHGTELEHPLIPPDQCVANSVSLESSRQVLMMSGSNMSGKSTLLRTVGCSAILAMAGAPVRAGHLRLSSLQVAASIRISDSLQQGISHFLAEVQRLGQVIQLTDGDWPVLFLLDEVLHGTNSHDRRIGAGALVRGLLQRKAIGIITTHDLALAELATEEPGRVENVHFADHMVDGKMIFDYRLQPGVVTHSNALELMRTVGLDV